MANSFTKQFPNSFSATQQTHEVLKNTDNETQKIYDVLNALNGTQIANTPAGNISATTVQAAINELDAEKAPKDSPTFTGRAGVVGWSGSAYLKSNSGTTGEIYLTGDNGTAEVGCKIATAYNGTNSIKNALTVGFSTNAQGYSGLDPSLLTYNTAFTLTRSGAFGLGGATDPKASLHSTGSTIYGVATTAVPDANIGNGQCNVWLNESTNQLTFRVRYSTGIYKTATLALT